MFQQILLCIVLFASVNTHTISDREVANLISLLKQSNDNVNSVSTKGIHEKTANGLIDSVKKEFHQFKTKYNKVYKNIQEEEIRLAAFYENRIVVKSHNTQFQKGEVAYEMEINHLSDLTKDEYDTTRGYRKSSVNGSSYIPLHLNNQLNIQLPTDIDWRARGAVTPVKNQGRCGSSYSFSAIGSLEGQVWRKTAKLFSLSAQQIVDCDQSEYGCNGGDMTKVFSYVKKVGGLMSENEYPYTSGTSCLPNERCNFIKPEVTATDTGFVQVPHDEATIQEVVATIGPVSIGIHSPPELLFYKSGIFYDQNCGKGPINHALLIVGYGTEKNTGTPYWIIKNSWGTSWGENGYFRIPRNVNACGITSDAVYPMV